MHRLARRTMFTVAVLWTILFLSNTKRSNANTVDIGPLGLEGVVFEGRWEKNIAYATADWPCASIRFLLDVTDKTVREISIDVEWNGVRSRLEVSLFDGPPLSNRLTSMIATKVFEGEPLDVLNVRTPKTASLKVSNVTLEKGKTYTVLARKLTTSCPFGSGIGGDLLRASTVRLFSVNVSSPAVRVIRSDPSAYGAKRRRRIEFIGASDTAGYCVDGTPKQSPIVYGPEGWLYENCNFGNTANLGRAFDADISVTAISGIGLTQNANARLPIEMGKRTMRDYWNFTMQSDDTHLWNFSQWTPDLVYVSLGGNDYNHQHGHVPDNATFTNAYIAFLERVLETYGPDVRVIGVCGQGSPVEAREDPDNNRCRPCPFVSDATDAFHVKHPELRRRVGYVFVPCDGSVVTGESDIGCAGHKNRIGQREVSDFLIPEISGFMEWGGSS